jgi:tetratricopeptide (TPR) repeat protein
MRRATGLALAALLAASAAAAQPEAERLKGAKALYFDRKYAEAREAWTAIRDAGGAEAEAAQYWIARCSESLGERERALREFGAYLERRPKDPTLVEEAKTSRVGLATRLYKEGRRQHLGIVQQALRDASRTVRYFAALQLSTLPPEVGSAAVPVLRRIVEEESDPDLVERAKLGLLRLDPRSLPAPSAAPRAREQTGRAPAAWIRIRIYKRSSERPEVAVNLPVALAELVFKSLPDDVRRDLREKGYDADNFWERLRKMGPMEILEIHGDGGERVQIWIE